MTFPFEDYNANQLRKIFIKMTKEAGMKFESKKSCGVSLTKILASRLARNRGNMIQFKLYIYYFKKRVMYYYNTCAIYYVGVKGFGNARDVESKLGDVFKSQTDRIGTILFRNPERQITPAEYRTLIRRDCIGDRPNLAESPLLKELDSMIGIASVKKSIHGLMHLQLQNYDREMEGKEAEQISLHRVFYGNPGKIVDYSTILWEL